MSWIILLSTIGFLLLILEFFLPGIILGVLGSVCLILAAIVTSVKYGATYGNLTITLLLFLTCVLIVLWIYLFPRSPIGKRMITSENLSESKSSNSLELLLNKEGITQSLLRPSGLVLIEKQRFDAIAESGFIEQQMPVKVVRTQGNQIVVRKI